MIFCNQCKLSIDTKKERYIKIEDNEGNKQLNKLYYHKNCWHEIMVSKTNNNKIQNEALKILEFAKNKLKYEDLNGI